MSEPRFIQIPKVPQTYDERSMRNLMQAVRHNLQQIISNGIGSTQFRTLYVDAVRAGNLPTLTTSPTDSEPPEEEERSNPGVISNLTATAAYSSIILDWVAPQTEWSHFEVWRQNSATLAQAKLIATTDVAGYHDASVLSQTAYYYWIRAVNVDVAGPYVGPVSATLIPDFDEIYAGIENDIFTDPLFTDLSGRVDTIESDVADLSDVTPFDANVAYEVGDLVSYLGRLYVCTQATTAPSPLPTDTNYWDDIGAYVSLGEAVAAHANQIEIINDPELGVVATATQQVYTTLGGTEAEVQVKAQSWDGTAAQWDVKTVVGDLVGGIGLLNDGVSTRLYVQADRFAVYGSDVPGDTSLGIPFVVEGGVTYIKDAAIRDAAIKNAKIDDLAVTTAKIGNLQVTDGKINDLSVTKLTAGTINAAITMTERLILSTAGKIYTSGKTSAASTTKGIFIGHDGVSNYDLAIGDATKSIVWDGSAGTLTINGEIIGRGNVVDGAVSESNYASKSTSGALILSGHVSTGKSIALNVTMLHNTQSESNTAYQARLRRRVNAGTWTTIKTWTEADEELNGGHELLFGSTYLNTGDLAAFLNDIPGAGTIDYELTWIAKPTDGSSTSYSYTIQTQEVVK